MSRIKKTDRPARTPGSLPSVQQNFLMPIPVAVALRRLAAERDVTLTELLLHALSETYPEIRAAADGAAEKHGEGGRA